MKITKNKQPATKPVIATSASTDKYAEARSYIRSAIDALQPMAKDDEIARDNIINMSVIIMDLTDTK